MGKHIAADGEPGFQLQSKEAPVAPARISRAPRPLSLIAFTLVAVVMGLCLLSTQQAAAQIIDPGDIELPDPPDVHLPDVDLPDVKLPDVDLPDPPDIDPPGPPDVDPPGDDDPRDPGGKTDTGDGPRDDGKKGAGGSSGSGDGPRRGGGAGGVPAPYEQLAAARGDAELVIVPSKPGSHSLTRPDDGDGGLMELLAPLGFPMLLMVAVGAWLTLQDHLDRRDPRHLLAAPKTQDQL